MVGEGSYLDGWRDALGHHFFNAQHVGCNVALCVDTELLDRIAQQHSLDNLIDSIEEECRLLSARRRNPLDLGVEQVIEWDQHRRPGYPPYLPILAFLIFAAGYEGLDFNDQDYWARVQHLRQSRVTDPEPLSRDKQIVEMLFRDLANWAGNIRRGEIGSFNFRRFGRLRYVGLVRAQSILSPADIRAICRTFSKHEFSAIQPPSRRELLHATLNARSQLRPSLARLLDKWPNDPLAEAALDRLEDVLAGWDGSAVKEDNSATERTTSFPILIELRPAGLHLRASFRIACGANEVPDELLLEYEAGKTLLAHFDAGELSQPLVSTCDDTTLNAATIDWSAGLRLAVKNSSAVSSARLQ